MSTLTWMIARSVPTPAAAASLAAASVVSGLLLVAIRHLNRVNMKHARLQRQVMNVTGEVSALRDESECRWLVQQLWASDRDQARAIFGPPQGQ